MNQTLYRTPNKVRGSALDRHTISDSFHNTSYPSFGYSCGPFRVYDHSQAKGQTKVWSKNKLAAEKRYDQELENLRQFRTL